jgi:hypothetical protein
MSYQEKRTWIYAVVAVAVSVVYFAITLGQLADTDVAQISYVRPLLTAAGVGIVANILADMLIGMPKGAERKDERDTGIYWHGTRTGYFVLAVGAGGAFILTLTGVAHFWIANALYLTFVMDALISSIVKIIAYRRGF